MPKCYHWFLIPNVRPHHLVQITIPNPTFQILIPGADFTNRLKLSQLSLCNKFKPKTDLSLFVKLAPGQKTTADFKGYLHWKYT